MQLSPEPLKGLTEGRIVHYCQGGTDHCQAAIVVKDWGHGKLNLYVFPDGSNDVKLGPGIPDNPILWMTSVEYQEPAPGHKSGPTNDAGIPAWHWPQNCSGNARD